MNEPSSKTRIAATAAIFVLSSGGDSRRHVMRGDLGSWQWAKSTPECINIY